jgi:hypothetical protein
MRLVKRALIFVHRWLGVALCVLFLLWFPSGIVMMYRSFPEVTARDRLEHAPALDPGTITVSPAEAVAKLEVDDPPTSARLTTFDGRPLYRFRRDGVERDVYADTGDEKPDEITPELMLRVAAQWSGQPASSASVREVTEIDQWTVANFRRVAPVWKYSFPDGQQVYVTENTAEVVQATTRASRTWAYLGAIPHWFYFTPLRKNGPTWSKVVIWTSGIGAASAILGMVIGVWMYSPRKRYRHAGAPTAIPYRGQKRLHTIFGLVFGAVAATWAFSGMLSMEPFPWPGQNVEPQRDGPSLPQLRGRLRFEAFAAKDPREVLAQLAPSRVKEIEFTGFAGAQMYLATLANGETRVVPLQGSPSPEFDRDRIVALIRGAAGEGGLADVTVIDRYDRYYLDRTGAQPLPVIRARLNDAQHTRFYVDPKTARIVAGYRTGDWGERWLYHGLHSLNFPWLYNYRPLWDIVVITLLVGGTALCVTSLILAWRVLGRKLKSIVPGASPAMSEDLAS